jgi:hypothetical protein
MTNVTPKPDSSQPRSEAAVHLFDNWFDPIEAGLRVPSRRQSSAILSSPRRPSKTMRILSSAEKCRRIARADVLQNLCRRVFPRHGFLSHLRFL